MEDEFEYTITPLMKYMAGDISKKDLERKLDNASGKQLFKTLDETRELVGYAYISNLPSKRKALKTALIPTAIAGTLGLLGNFLRILPDYKEPLSALEFSILSAGIIVPTLSTLVGGFNYLTSESTSYLRKAKKAARMIAKSILNVRKELPYLAYNLEDIEGRINPRFSGLG